MKHPEWEPLWKKALEAWETPALLSRPMDLSESSGEHDAIAYIDLNARQVFVDIKQLAHYKIEGCLTALFAHEIGHHLEYPHSLRLSARLELVANEILPLFSPFHLNLFYDFLINERLGRKKEFREAFIKLYRALSRNPESQLFQFYLRVYELLWDCPKAFVDQPDSSIDNLAEVFSQVFFDIDGIYDQFVYFCATIYRFVMEDQKKAEEAFARMKMGDIDGPSPDDYPGDLAPGKEAEDAMERAKEKGWLPKEGESPKGKKAEAEKTFRRLRRLTHQRPGDQQIEFRRLLSEKLYRHLVEKTLASLPEFPAIPQLDPFLPSGTEEWEPGEETAAIDWTETLVRRGDWGSLQPLKREYLVDELGEGTQRVPVSLEIYLDTSGSMPNPVDDLNVMTLAALVLSTYVIRKGAKVRGVIYSSGRPLTSDWMRDEGKAREFLTNYSGGGTDFPFAFFRESCREFKKVFRIVISDSDFIYNLREHKNPRELVEGAVASQQLVLFLHGVSRAELAQVLPKPWPSSLQLVTVLDVAEFGQLAAKLARGLMGE